MDGDTAFSASTGGLDLISGFRHRLTGDYYYEGGDLEKVGDGNVLIATDRYSTNNRGAEWIKRILELDGFQVTKVPLNDTGILHLYAVLCFAGPGIAIAFRDSFKGGELPRPIRGWDTIWATDEEARQGACCNVMLDSKRMLIPATTPRVGDELVKRGIEPIPVEISAHMALGGGIRCVTGMIHREID